jgi:PAS domain S-box-containing protein
VKVRARLAASPTRHRRTITLVAVALFALVFALRMVVAAHNQGILLFFAVPIALLGIEFEVAGGAAGACGAIALLAIYAIVHVPHLGVLGYCSVIIAFVLIGGVVGVLAQRLRRAVAAREHAEGQLQVEAARRASESLKAAILDASLDCLITIDHTGRVLEFNRAAQKTFGYTAEEAVGRELGGLIVPPELRQRHRIGVRRRVYADEGSVLDRRIELSGMSKDGSIFPVELAVTRIRGTDPPVFAGYIRDITERREAEERARVQSEEIAKLAEARGELVAQLLLAEERTRRRIAQVLHDDALQRLLAANQDLIEAAPGRSGVSRAHETLEGTIQQLRDAVVALHPITLEQGDLETALNAIARQHAGRGGFRYTVRVEDDAAGHEDELVLSLAREFLANVARHAEASRCSVTVTRRRDRIVLEIADDGKGMPQERQAEAFHEGHIGLASSLQRVRATGGEAEVSSEPQKGTVIRSLIPIAARARVRQPD